MPDVDPTVPPARGEPVERAGDLSPLTNLRPPSADPHQYLRLPHGFHTRDASFLGVLRTVVSALSMGSLEAGYGHVLFPSLGFASTFERGADTMGDKAYVFNDRGGRRVVLSPDSTPGLFRWYLDAFPCGDEAKVTWFAPLYRYRNVPNRAFHQFGIGFVNSQVLPPSAPDLPLAEATNFMLKLFGVHFGVPVTVQVSNVGAFRRHLRSALGNEERAAQILSDLYSAKDVDARVQIVNHAVPEGVDRDVLGALLRGDSATHLPRSNVPLQAAYQEMTNFSVLLYGSPSVKFAPADLHASQTLSGLGVRFIGPNGAGLGDGGRFDVYGRNFDPRIKSAVSVCSGVEGLFRQIGARYIPAATDLALIVFSEYASEGFAMAEELRSKGFSVRLSYVGDSVRKAISVGSKGSAAFVVFGAQEVVSGEVQVTTVHNNQRVRVTRAGLEVFLRDQQSRRTSQSAALQPPAHPQLEAE